MALGVKASLEGGVLVRDSPMLHQGSLRGHQVRYEDICGGYDWGVLLASSGWGPICTGHRPASQSPIQNLLVLFGSKAEAGTRQETDITGRPSPGGWGSKSAAQMAPRCGHPHGVGGTVKATTSAQAPGPAAGSPQPWPFPTPSQACQGHGSWSPVPGMRAQDRDPQWPVHSHTCVDTGDTAGRKHRDVGWLHDICGSCCVYTFVNSPSFPST